MIPLGVSFSEQKTTEKRGRPEASLTRVTIGLPGTVCTLCGLWSLWCKWNELGDTFTSYGTVLYPFHQVGFHESRTAG